MTGISSTHSHQAHHYAVNDPSKARIAGRKKPKPKYPTDVFTQFYAADIERQSSRLQGETIGFVVHAHCWAMFNRVEELSNVNLGRLVRVCRRYWRESSTPLGISPDLYSVSESPLIVPTIQKAIIRAKTDYYHPSSSFDILPLELRVLICELTCPITGYTISDIQNLKNLLSGFGWELPKWFWQVRLDERLFFELKSHDEDPSVDWRMRLEFMILDAERDRLGCCGIANRERILGIMLALGAAYEAR